MVTNVIVINKKSYGLPIYATTNGVIYNKNIFKNMIWKYRILMKNLFRFVIR